MKKLLGLSLLLFVLIMNINATNVTVSIKGKGGTTNTTTINNGVTTTITHICPEASSAECASVNAEIGNGSNKAPTSGSIGILTIGENVFNVKIINIGSFEATKTGYVAIGVDVIILK